MSASAEYMKEWRKTPSGKASLAAQRIREKARRDAVAKLIANYQQEFNKLYYQELAR